MITILLALSCTGVGGLSRQSTPSSAATQAAYLKASNTDPGDWFGMAIAVSGDTLVVGAPREESASMGVGADQSDNSLTRSGAAYVFVRRQNGWEQQAYLKASNPDGFDGFGSAVAICGDTIVVGAEREDSDATGVNGDQGNFPLWSSGEGFSFNAGAAYVFVRENGTWRQQAYLKASNSGSGDRFGRAVAISGDRIVIGAHGESSDATGVDGDQGDGANFIQAGAAYLFHRAGGQWSQEAYLKASNTDSGDLFGYSVAISGETVVVSAPLESSGATRIDGNSADNSEPRAGAAYVFTKGPSGWFQEAYVKASNSSSNDQFGITTTLSGNRFVVGAPLEDSIAVGVGGDQQNDNATDSGAAYVFEREGGVWSLEAYLKPLHTDPHDHFGVVSLSGDTLLIGASGEDSSAVGLNGDASDNQLLDSGAGYVFLREEGAWHQELYVKADQTSAFDLFGSAVVVAGSTALFGALLEDSDSTGVNGDASNDAATDSGATYVLDLGPIDSPGQFVCSGDGSGSTCPCGPGSTGAGCANSSSSGARLAGTGLAQFTDDRFALEVSGLPPGSLGLCVKGSALMSGGAGNPLGDGLLCTSPELRSQPLAASSTGERLMEFWRGQPFGQFPGAANLGAPTYYQWWFRDPAGTCTGQDFNFSNAWEVTWLP